MPSMGTMSLGLAVRTEEFERNMERARGATKRFAADAHAAGQHGKHSFQLLGDQSVLFSRMGRRGFKEVSDAALLFGGTAEGVAGKVSGAFAHMLHGLGHGGVAGLAFVGVTTAIGMIGEAFAKSKEHAEKAEEEKRKALEKTRADAERLAQQAETDAERVAQTMERLDEQQFAAHLRMLEKKAAANGSYFDATAAKERHENGRSIIAARKQLNDELAAIAELQAKKRGADGETAALLDKAISKRDQNVAAIRREIDALKDRRNEIDKEAGERQREKVSAEVEAYERRKQERVDAETKAYGDQRVALRAALDEKQKMAGLSAEEAQAVRDTATAEAMRRAGLAVEARQYELLVKYEKDLAKYNEDEAKRNAANERAKKENEALAKRLELLQASTEMERLQVQHRQEYVKLVEAGANPARVQAVHAEETKRLLSEQNAERAKYFESLSRTLDLERAVTDEQRKQVQRAQELREAQEKYGQEAVAAIQKIHAAQDAADKKRKQMADDAARKSGWESGGPGPLASAREAKRNKARAERFANHQANLDAERGPQGRMGFTMEGDAGWKATAAPSSEFGKEPVINDETGEVEWKWKRRKSDAEKRAAWQRMMKRYRNSGGVPPKDAGQPIPDDVYGKGGPPPAKPEGLPGVETPPQKPGELPGDTSKLNEALNAQKAALDAAKKALDDTAKAQGDNVQPTQDAAKSAEDLKGKTEELKEPLTEVATGLQAAVEAMGGAVEVVRGLAKDVKELKAAVETLQKAGG